MDSYVISGMTCAGCAAKVQRTLKELDPNISVTLDPPRVAGAGRVAVNAMNEALVAVGKYRVLDAEVTPQASTGFLLQTYYPLFLIVGLCALAALAANRWMIGFMAAFYIVFGAFKLLDVSSFALAYKRYDVVAKRVPAWGLAYPFVEVGLGFAFLFSSHGYVMAWAALIISLVGAVGVVQSVLRKETIQCACLGTVFQLPMSTVTIVENLGMAAMAAWMLIFGN